MNLRDLKYIIAVAEHHHFGKAADACFVSQPALSMQIKKFEEELGVVIFERNNKHVMLTDIGKTIIKKAQSIIQDSNDLLELAKLHHNPSTGTLAIGAFPTLAPYLYPNIVPNIKNQHPELSLRLIEDKTKHLIDQLMLGDIDAAFLAYPFPHEHLNITIQEIFCEPFYLATSKMHPLASKRHVTIDDLKHHQLLLLDEGHCLRDQALDICSTANIQHNTDVRGTSLETVKQMVAANEGITLIPHLAIQQPQEHICYIPFKGKPYYRTIALCWRQTSPKHTLLHELANNMTPLEHNH